MTNAQKALHILDIFDVLRPWSFCLEISSSPLRKKNNPLYSKLRLIALHDHYKRVNTMLIELSKPGLTFGRELDNELLEYYDRIKPYAGQYIDEDVMMKIFIERI